MKPEYIYQKYYAKCDPESYSIWKVDVDKTTMLCLYRSYTYITNISEQQCDYMEPSTNHIIEELTKDEAFLIML